MSKTPAIRLTNQARACIVRAAVLAEFTPRLEAGRSRQQATARAVYDAIIPPQVRAEMTRLEAECVARWREAGGDENSGWTMLWRAEYVRVYHKDYGCSGHRLSLGETRISMGHYGITLRAQKEGEVPPLVAEALAAVDEERALKQEQTNWEVALETALAGCRTLADLEREWPEGRPHYAFLYPSTSPAGPSTLPARLDPFAPFRNVTAPAAAE